MNHSQIFLNLATTKLVTTKHLKLLIFWKRQVESLRFKV